MCFKKIFGICGYSAPKYYSINESRIETKDYFLNNYKKLHLNNVQVINHYNFLNNHGITKPWQLRVINLFLLALMCFVLFICISITILIAGMITWCVYLLINSDNIDIDVSYKLGLTFSILTMLCVISSITTCILIRHWISNICTRLLFIRYSGEIVQYISGTSNYIRTPQV
jgi:hypothetical protein